MHRTSSAGARLKLGILGGMSGRYRTVDSTEGEILASMYDYTHAGISTSLAKLCGLQMVTISCSDALRVNDQGFIQDLHAAQMI